MGVIKHRDVFSAKFLTAIISDSNDRGYFVPIKKTIGDFFIVELNGNLYAFTLEGARILTYREFMVRSVKFVEYDTSHFRSLQGYMKELELCLKQNMLPKMNRVQLAALRVLGRKERWVANGQEISKRKYDIIKERNNIKDRYLQNKMAIQRDPSIDEIEFKPYEIKTLLDELAEQQSDFPEETENMTNYLKSLDVDRIVTPIGKLTDSLQDDLITTKASYLGELTPRLQRLDNEHKGISNKPITGKIPYLKLMFVTMMILGIAAFIYFGIEEGWFDSITSMFPNPSSFTGASNPFTPPLAAKQANQCSDEALQAKYTPLELKLAIEDGRETCKLSPTMQKLVDGVDLPKAEVQP